MNRFSTRVVVLFALVATFPVALTGIVWLAVSQWGAGTGTGEAEMARTQLAALDAQRKAAVSRLCRDDLAVDTLLRDRSKETPSELDYDRLFRGSMEAAGLQALWVLDSLSGDVIATGHRHRLTRRRWRRDDPPGQERRGPRVRAGCWATKSTRGSWSGRARCTRGGAT